MAAVGQPVDDRHGGVLHHFLEMRHADGAQQDDVDIARQHPRRIGDGLAPAELRFGMAQYDHLAAELAHADLEGDPGAGRRLLENHRQGLAREGRRIAARRRAALEGGAEIEDFAQGGGREVGEIEEVLHAAAATLAEGGLVRFRWSGQRHVRAPNRRNCDRGCPGPRRCGCRR